MSKYICQRCLKDFKHKSHYKRHCTRKTPCQDNKDKIKEIVNEVVEEKLNKVEKTVNQEQNVNVLDLFGGCGGMSHGFKQCGFNITCCNEYETQIAKTYKANNIGTHMVVDDITKDTTKNEIYQVFNDKKCDMIIGGPPCVAYSMAGKRDSRDPRGQLFRDYIIIVKSLRPKIIIMENVKGILSIKHDKDNMSTEETIISNKYYDLEKRKIEILNKKKTHSLSIDEVSSLRNINKEMNGMKDSMKTIRIGVIHKIISELEKLGYLVTYKLLNTADFGVPQKRERVIFVGILKSINKEYSFPKPTHIDKHISVKTAIHDLVEKEENLEFSHIFTNHSPEFLEKIKRTEIGQSLNPRYKEAFHKCHPDRPSNTVKENHGGVFLHYQNPRVMTPRELARLQSFPDDFKFLGTKSNILKQIGNAVPCKFSYVIAKSLKEQIFN